jgi:hypothetical protein
MRTKLLSFLMLLTVAINYGQITATSSSVAIQGIARDDNGNARANTQIPLTLQLYYKLNGTNTTISTQTISNVTTDAFGVFSTFLDIDKNKYPTLAANQTFLKISGKNTSNQDVTISDQAFTQVPYAIMANNGVPTGSIMPYIGTTAPVGWALCDGARLSTDGSAAALITLVGDYAPDLRGMFLRGAGENTANAAEIEPNTLKGVQTSENKSHKHTGTTNAAGNHSHQYRYFDKDTNGGGFDGGGNWLGLNTSGRTDTTGDHTHPFTTDLDGNATESRPINFGVNYIIKL